MGSDPAYFLMKCHNQIPLRFAQGSAVKSSQTRRPLAGQASLAAKCAQNSPIAKPMLKGGCYPPVPHRRAMCHSGAPIRWPIPVNKRVLEHFAQALRGEGQQDPQPHDDQPQMISPSQGQAVSERITAPRCRPSIIWPAGIGGVRSAGRVTPPRHPRSNRRS